MSGRPRVHESRGMAERPGIDSHHTFEALIIGVGRIANAGREGVSDGFTRARRQV